MERIVRAPRETIREGVAVIGPPGSGKTTLLHTLAADLLRERDANSLIYFGSAGGKGEPLEKLIPRTRLHPPGPSSLTASVESTIRHGEALPLLYAVERYADAFDHLCWTLDYLASNPQLPERGRVILLIDEFTSMIPSRGESATHFGESMGKALREHPRLIPAVSCFGAEDLGAVIDRPNKTPFMHALRTLLFTRSHGPAGEDPLTLLTGNQSLSATELRLGEYISFDQLTGACRKGDFSKDGYFWKF